MRRIKVWSQQYRLLVMADSVVAFLILVRSDTLVEFFDRVFWEMSPVLYGIDEIRVAPVFSLRHRLLLARLARGQGYLRYGHCGDRRVECDQLIDWRETVVANHHMVGIVYKAVESELSLIIAV